MTEYVEYARADGASTITLNRPEKLNAMTPGMWTAVAEGIERAVEEGARAAVLTGTGEAFCAGDDIATLAAIDAERGVRELTSVVLDCFATIEGAPIPVVGNANGPAHGGGFELLVACDLTVVPESATFSLPEVRIGAFPFYGTKRLARIVGRQRAAELALTAREIDADRAVEWGLVARATPADATDEVVAEWIDAFEAASPAAVETTKAWLNATLKVPGEDDAMRSGLGYLFAGPDAIEGARAFLEDREPDFGR